VNKIILALDTTNLEEAINIVKRVKSKIFTIKLGLEFFNAHGKEGIKKL
jgi:orotidine-5'-phosphate decarboxylase